MTLLKGCDCYPNPRWRQQLDLNLELYFQLADERGGVFAHHRGQPRWWRCRSVASPKFLASRAIRRGRTS